ncbi:hypothetical protein [Pelagibius marinus]|uniref:hypothetical protein n=1 Tax=Pelagibius marinus TaxID=2762760 RepID=UPI0018727131|nr:hypothetical protein [Pelagibius marinus]
MSMPDPFNPGPLSDDYRHQYRHDAELPAGDKAPLWVLLGILGAIGVFFIVVTL